MSSVNFEKIKQNGKPMSSYIRHNDTQERLIHNHKNEDINKELTENNIDWNGIDYDKAVQRYNNRIEELDKVEGQNKRKDRVTAFALCLTIPEKVTDKEAFFNDVMEIFIRDFDERNIIQANLHVDEKHDYIDDGKVKTSLEHIHCLVIPEINGKLCGKKFSSKNAMSGLNKEIDKMCKEKYKCDFLTHETPQHKTVEELKAKGEAEKKALQQLADTDIVETKRKGLTDVILPKKEYEKLTLQAAKYEQIDKKNNEIKANINTVKEAHKELQSDINASKTILNKADKAKEIAQMLPAMERKKESLEDDIEIAVNELTALQKQKEEYGDSLKNQAKFAKIELENSNLKSELSTIRTGIQRIIETLDKSNMPMSNKIKKALEKLINKDSNNHIQKKDEREI